MGELLGRIDARELSAWQAYEQVTGTLGPERIDLLVARATCDVVRALIGKKGRRLKPSDFMVVWDPELERIERLRAAERQTPEDHLRLVRGLTRAMGGHERKAGDDVGTR